ncbi:MAG: TIGR03905 family TSCPD domain-containing protein, partial [Clostridia bacterium]|nr:TIGR03905 family TSCPD domain-containing protein [Clostridia bacterium]
MTYKFKTTGVCSRSITLELEDGILKDVQFEGGCAGNAQGIVALVRGMPAQDVVRRLKHIKCETKSTSCPDQLAIAIEEAMKNPGSSGARPGPA